MNVIRHLRMKGFGQLLLTLIAVTLLQPLISRYRVLSLLTLIAVLDGLYVAIPSDIGAQFRRWLNTIWLLTTALIVASLVLERGTARDSADIGGSILLTVLFAICFGATIRYVLRERRVTLDLLYAAMVGYFFIVTTFAGMYNVAVVINPASFQFQAWYTDVATIDFRTQLTYFSFVTAASLGYGDILPKGPFIQMLAVIEVVIGQFYLATVIARLVSLYGNEPKPGASNEP